MVNWGVHLPWVYVHSSICDTYSVKWCSTDLWLIGAYICHGYMCILLYVTLIQCSGVPEMYGQLGGGVDLPVDLPLHLPI